MHCSLKQVSGKVFGLAKRPAERQEQKRHDRYWSNSLHDDAVLRKSAATSTMPGNWGCKHTLTPHLRCHSCEQSAYVPPELGQAIAENPGGSSMSRNVPPFNGLNG